MDNYRLLSGIGSGYYNHSVDETDATYNYYGYINIEGVILFMRTNKFGTETRYCVAGNVLAGTNFSTVWADRAGYPYNFVCNIAI